MKQQEQTFNETNSQLQEELKKTRSILQSKILFDDTKFPEYNQVNVPSYDSSKKVNKKFGLSFFCFENIDFIDLKKKERETMKAILSVISNLFASMNEHYTAFQEKLVLLNNHTDISPSLIQINKQVTKNSFFFQVKDFNF